MLILCRNPTCARLQGVQNVTLTLALLGNMSKLSTVQSSMPIRNIKVTVLVNRRGGMMEIRLSVFSKFYVYMTWHYNCKFSFQI